MTHDRTSGRTHRTVKATVATATVAIAAAGLLAACSSSGSKSSGSTSGASSSTGASSASSAGGNTVQVKNFSFSPSSLSVAKGTTVTWKFDDSAKHNVTDGKNTFKSKDLASGGSYSFTFNTAGTYNYICTIHQYMKGSVTVK
jgi:plastocyanin